MSALADSAFRRLMYRRPRLAVLAAALVSAPLFALALTGAVYIAYSLLAQSWYRDMFWAYGAKLLLLYVFFAAGIAAAAAVALRLPRRHERATRIGLFGACIAGVVAAAFLEIAFWSDADRFLPQGCSSCRSLAGRSLH